MIYCIAEIPEDEAELLCLYASVVGLSISQIFGILVERSTIPVEIYDSGILRARSAKYIG